MVYYPELQAEPIEGAKRPGKVVITRIGLDAHDRGSRIVASYLRDAGLEVVYTPPWQTIEQVVDIVSEEDVDVLGVSSLAGDHMLIPKLILALRSAELQRVQVVVGGIIPDVELQVLREAGVVDYFPPSSTREVIVTRIRELVKLARRQPAF